MSFKFKSLVLFIKIIESIRASFHWLASVSFNKSLQFSDASVKFALMPRFTT